MSREPCGFATPAGPRGGDEVPEQLTRHPDVTLQVLRSAGAQCGTGSPPKILTACPPARFCRLPGGEICVYGLDDALQMTQVTAGEWRAVQIGRASCRERVLLRV